MNEAVTRAQVSVLFIRSDSCYFHLVNSFLDIDGLMIG